MNWTACVFTVFPEVYPGTLGVSKLKKGLDDGVWNLSVIDLKKFGDKYGRIDDSPYGGGVGMVLRSDCFEKAFNSIPENLQKLKKIYFSPRGKKIFQNDFKSLSKSSGVVILCGRYEGVDQRILDYYSFEEWSLGDFVLMGGDVAALAVIEGCVRLLPGIVQKEESLEEDSFENGLLEYNQYTKPYDFNGMKINDILLSGNHGKIKEFRLQESKEITKCLRPDLWYSYVKSFVLNGK